MLSGLAPARRRLALGLAALVVVAALALTAALVVPRLTAGDVAAVPQETVGPVLLVPGYGGSTASLQTLADRLRAEGRDAEVVEVPGDGTGDMNASADVLGEAVDAALARTGATSVDVVGYSAGGVITRLWLADGGADQARRVVLLGTPNHGTRLADLGQDVGPSVCPEACQQLTTDSALLAELNAGDETPPGPTYVSIWTTADTTVTPPETARLDGALDLQVQSVCADSRVEHGQLPRDPLVQAMVLAELAPGPPVPLTAADCARLSAA
ncbi:alpha/beta fold hydrolase [Modestobacter sp. I12A-02628]|uniref:Alpha/beta fold hydrolase n=1 Tax=Goekera deserti TaxID=2497753 RepID=A0A7K3WAG9_9ACTN|nr:alpha/beta fold hydrolase [Goekera deserti]MPQ97693.1 alpha/beta fold hydrolase [Goekera deserti]NDI47640.1 alpha/beta fold hydrolase [Goekera deserti]NDI47703.1 alpha/beta fold hydrolase [Goekera deserti]NEL53451.1 alpha/beta fold hydrolase [Goekera deserti]